jgi:hypothetical protein
MKIRRRPKAFKLHPSLDAWGVILNIEDLRLKAAWLERHFHYQLRQH